MRDVKLELLPIERLESFLDALWLCIRPFFGYTLTPSVFAYPPCKIEFATHGRLDSFPYIHALGILPFLCCILE